MPTISKTHLATEHPLVAKYLLAPGYRDEEAWQWYKKALASFWTTEEVDLSADQRDWEQLEDKERHFIAQVLAFFAAADGVVAENALRRFYDEIEDSSTRAFYGMQVFIEQIHNQMYSELIFTYVSEPRKQQQLFEAVESDPHVARKVAWASRWLESPDSLATRLFAYACVEGIFFSSSFCAIFWLKKRGLMPGLTFSNELISRDESLHCEFGCFLFNRLRVPSETPDSVLHAIVSEAVEIETAFVQDALRADLIGMNSASMVQYVQTMADRLLASVGVERLFGTENPFEWMEMINYRTQKTNFFESRVSSYQLACGVKQSVQFTTDVEF